MDAELRKAIYKKKKCYIISTKNLKLNQNGKCIEFKETRNYVTKLRKQSIQLYVFERCNGGLILKIFWPTIKSFLSSKNSKKDCDIKLLVNDKLISDQKEVSSLLNDFNINIVREIGIDSQFLDLANHPI